MRPDRHAKRPPPNPTVVKAPPDAVPPRGVEDHRPPPGGDPSRRGLIVAFIFVIVLAGAGFSIVRTMMTMAKLQDCAASGRRDC